MKITITIYFIFDLRLTRNPDYAASTKQRMSTDKNVYARHRHLIITNQSSFVRTTYHHRNIRVVEYCRTYSVDFFSIHCTQIEMNERILFCKWWQNILFFSSSIITSITGETNEANKLLSKQIIFIQLIFSIFSLLGL